MPVSRTPKPPCPKCGSYNQIILDTRKQTESLYKRRYQCMECDKIFSAYAEYSNYEEGNSLVYTTKFTYTKYKARAANGQQQASGGESLQSYGSPTLGRR